MARELAQAGFEDIFTTNLQPVDPVEAVQAVGLQTNSTVQNMDGPGLAANIAQTIAPNRGIGLAMIGPMADGSTYIALHGPGEFELVKFARIFRREADYNRRWLVVQGLDWVRRTVLGQLKSPADWD